jgi:hypothetical protein
MAALLSGVLLLGGVLPGLQGLCAEMASASSETAMHADAAAMPHDAASSPDCEDDCAGIACCVSVASLTDAPDLRLPDRGAAADLTRLRSEESVSIPAPDRDNSGWAQEFDPDPVLPVRLHVWTATFLS